MLILSAPVSPCPVAQGIHEFSNQLLKRLFCSSLKWFLPLTKAIDSACMSSLWVELVFSWHSIMWKHISPGLSSNFSHKIFVQVSFWSVPLGLPLPFMGWSTLNRLFWHMHVEMFSLCLPLTVSRLNFSSTDWNPEPWAWVLCTA